MIIKKVNRPFKLVKFAAFDDNRVLYSVREKTDKLLLNLSFDQRAIKTFIQQDNGIDIVITFGDEDTYSQFIRENMDRLIPGYTYYETPKNHSVMYVGSITSRDDLVVYLNFENIFHSHSPLSDIITKN